MTFEGPFWEANGGTDFLHLGRSDSAEFPMFLDLRRSVDEVPQRSISIRSASRAGLDQLDQIALGILHVGEARTGLSRICRWPDRGGTGPDDL
jgi:hypothetical protein